MAHRNGFCHYLTAAFAAAPETPDIGRAYQYIATDVVARFKSLDGFQVHRLADVDELRAESIRGAATVTGRARSPEHLDSDLHEHLQRVLNVSFDRVIRTTDTEHQNVWRVLWNSMLAKGDLYVDTYAGWYSTLDGAFHSGAGVRIGNDGSCTAASSGVPVEWTRASCYFFRLSRFRERLLAFHRARPDFITPSSRRPELLSSLSRELPDIPVALAIEEKRGNSGRSENSLSGGLRGLAGALAEMAEIVGARSDNFPNQPRILHVIGQDDLHRHAVYWPAVLMSTEIEISYRLFAHGSALGKSTTVSGATAKPHATDPFELVRKYGRDRIRYFLLREAPFGSEWEYSHQGVISLTENDLAQNLSTAAYNVLSLLSKHCHGKVPCPSSPCERDMDLVRSADALLPQCREYIDAQQFHLMLKEIWSVIEDVGRYISAEKPWGLRTTDPNRMNTIVYTALDVLRTVGVLIQPIVPETATRLLDQLAVPCRSFNGLDHRIEPGTALPEPQRVFPRYRRRPSKESPIAVGATPP
ncbi:methionine--tRNA ligase [Rhodococcus artemisiae]|uniref:methionine--tRNA ligase n=1 Tax=Rhodococcus artemisiae TaxID=714159 RepID=A0ABU7LBU2_9NOCA|nr:methionine--tRNA ligase [Rhodococcus artemisiae]MEE2059019.1 methionine--tRNA ligase [Rhodococcus artemisiae]